MPKATPVWEEMEHFKRRVKEMPQVMNATFNDQTQLLTIALRGITRISDEKMVRVAKIHKFRVQPLQYHPEHPTWQLTWKGSGLRHIATVFVHRTGFVYVAPKMPTVHPFSASKLMRLITDLGISTE